MLTIVFRRGCRNEADNYLKEAWKLEPMLPVGIIQHLLITEAAYYESKEEYEKALDVYDRFFKGKGTAEQSRIVY